MPPDPPEVKYIINWQILIIYLPYLSLIADQLCELIEIWKDRRSSQLLADLFFWSFQDLPFYNYKHHDVLLIRYLQHQIRTPIHRHSKTNWRIIPYLNTPAYFFPALRNHINLFRSFPGNQIFSARFLWSKPSS